jgi:deoxyribodipyrimidine photo-lyase
MENFPPNKNAALERMDAVRPDEYAKTRNDLRGAVTGLSPYITHGLVSVPEVLNRVRAHHQLHQEHQFVKELGWREYFNHVWSFKGEGIFQSLHEGILSESSYAQVLPQEVREANTGLPVIDMAVRTLYTTGYLHNHARMWLASYLVHIRKVHWLVGADWLYGHLLDGDLASNHLSWQWVAGTGSSKPYLFNADNVAKYAPKAWHSPQTVIDQSYEELDHMARSERSFDALVPQKFKPGAVQEPLLSGIPPEDFRLSSPVQLDLKGRDVWLVHPWNLGDLPEHLPPGCVVVGLFLSDFHQAWPWSDRRWRFVHDRMRELVWVMTLGTAQSMALALEGAASVRSSYTPHLKAWLPLLAKCEPQSLHFRTVDRCCKSFSKWWHCVS